MKNQQEQHRPLSGPEDWDERYSAEDGETIWSGQPNGALVAEVSAMEPRRALDLGCGEGADAIWLASRGWEVTGIDISRVALDRAREAADASDVFVEWVWADFVRQPSTPAGFDLVSTHYPALLKTEADESISALLSGVAPGGTLLFVVHEVTDLEYARSHGFDPDDYLGPDDVASRLDDSWTIEIDETRERHSPSNEPSPHSQDLILKARRTD